MFRQTVAGCVGVLLFASALRAEPVTITGSGTVIGACGPCLTEALGFSATEGDPFSFSISYTDVSVGQYPEPTKSNEFALSGGGFTFVLPAGSVSIPGTMRGFSLIPGAYGETDLNTQLTVLSSYVFERATIKFLDFSAVDPNNNFLGTAAWPKNLLAVLAGVPAFVSIGVIEGEEVPRILDGRVQHLAGASEPSPIPEPTTVLLIGAGGLALVARRRGVRAKSKPTAHR